MTKYIANTIDRLYKDLSQYFDNKDQFLEIMNVGKDKIKLPTLSSLNTKQKYSFKLANRNKKSLFLILHGAIRSGKSYIGIYIFIYKILKAKEGELFLATGYNLSVLRNNIEQIFSEFGMECGRDYTYNHLLYRYQVNKKVIRLCGANNIRSYANIRGCTASGWYANEIVLQNKEVVLECIKRVSTKKRFKIWDSNPAGCQHYIYQDFILKAEEKGIDEVSFQITDNIDNIPIDYIDEQKALLSENDQKVYLDGLWLDNIDTPFFHLKIEKLDPDKLRNSFSDRIAFLDPATGQHEKSSKSALSIIFHAGGDNFYFVGKCFKGLWSSHLVEIANILNYLKVPTFAYESNLIGKGSIEREFEFIKLYNGKIISIRNTTEKIARISSIINVIEKGKLMALDFSCEDFINDIKYSNISTKDNLDAVDSLESCYRLITT